MKRFGFLFLFTALLGLMLPSPRLCAEPQGENTTISAVTAPKKLYDEEEDIQYQTTPVLVDYQGKKDRGLYPCVYSDEAFFAPSNVYSHFLAKQSIGLALSSFHLVDEDGVADDSFEVPEGTLYTYFLALDFHTIRADDYMKETSLYTVGSAIGRKTIEKNGEFYDLVAVGIRGGNYKNEWQSNFTLDSDTRHRGFDEAATLVTDRILSYISQNKFDHPIKVWLSGFSRAGAVTNLVAANLNDSSLLDKSQVYAYTFAAPRPTWVLEGEEIITGYDNIFNIYGASDLIPQFVPAEWNYYHYGVDMQLIGSEFDSEFSAKYGRVQEKLKEEGVTTSYNTELNLRMRMLFGMLLEIAHDEFEFKDYLQPIFLKLLQTQGLNARVELLRTTIMEWAAASPEGAEKKDHVIDFAIETIRPLLFGGGFMDNGASSANNTLFLIVHEHFPEVYLHMLYDLSKEEAFAGASDFAYITLKGGKYTLVDKSVDKVVLTVENGEKKMAAYGQEEGLDLPLIYIKGAPLLVLPYDRDYELRYELNNGETAEAYVQPYGSTFSSHLQKYVSSLDGNAPRSGVILSVDGGVATYQGARSASTPTEFVYHLKIQNGLMPYRVYVFFVGMIVGLIIVALLWILVAVQAALAKRKVSFLRLGLLSLYILCLIEGEIAFWFFADLVFVGIVAKIIAGLILIALYLLGKKLKDLKRIDKTILPFLVTALAGNVVLSVSIPIGLIFIALGISYLCFLNLRARRMASSQWFVFGVTAALFIGFAVILLNPLSFADVAYLLTIPVALLYCFSSFKAEGQKEVASFVMLIALAAMAPYLYGSIVFVSLLLFVLFINISMIIHALYYDAPDLDLDALRLGTEEDAAEEAVAEQV